MEGLNGEKASLMDLKIGKSTITVKCQKLNKQNSRFEKDLATISNQYGFKITGYVLRNNKNGEEIEKFFKRPYKNYEETKMKLFKLFSIDNQNISERDEGFQEIRLNIKALMYLINFLSEMIVFMKC